MYTHTRPSVRAQWESFDVHPEAGDDEMFLVLQRRARSAWTTGKVLSHRNVPNSVLQAMTWAIDVLAYGVGLVLPVSVAYGVASVAQGCDRKRQAYLPAVRNIYV